MVEFVYLPRIIIFRVMVRNLRSHKVYCAYSSEEITIVYSAMKVQVNKDRTWISAISYNTNL